MIWFGILISDLTSKLVVIIGATLRQNESFQSHMRLIMTYGKGYNVSAELTQRIISYEKHMLDRIHVPAPNAKSILFDSMPTNLRRDVFMQLVRFIY